MWRVTRALPLRMAKRWVQLYRRFGLAELTRRGRADHGKRRSIPPALLDLVEGLALQEAPLSVAAIYREVCRPPLGEEQALPGYYSILSRHQTRAGHSYDLGPRSRSSCRHHPHHRRRLPPLPSPVIFCASTTCRRLGRLSWKRCARRLTAGRT